MRLFISVDLPSDFADAIAEVQAELEPASGIRSTDPTQAHLTLKFLGEVSPDEVETIIDGLEVAIDRVGTAPFEASVEGIGAFPDTSYIRVVWLGIESGSDRLVDLAEAVETELVERGFLPSDHEFTPHVTIARMSHGGGKDLVKRIVTERHPTIGRMTVDSVALTESALTDDGTVYSTVERVPLTDSGA